MKKGAPFCPVEQFRLMALDIEEVLHWEIKVEQEEKKMKNHKRAMINDLKINRHSKSSIFFRFQWSLNMHVERGKKMKSFPNRRAENEKCFVHFHDFSLFNNRFIYWKSN